MSAQKEEQYDEDKECYVALADEMNDPDVGPWVESDWDPHYVGCGKRYAKQNGYNWPPRMGDFDRWYDEEHNS